MWSPFDRAQLASPLAIDAGESCWYCFEGAGISASGPRRVAGLVWLHRTGPRLRKLGLGVSVIERNLVPRPLRALLPAWLPLIAPFTIESDSRPLLLVALYDLDAPHRGPRAIEAPIEHAALDLTTLSGVTHDEHLAITHELTDGGWGVRVTARGDGLELELRGRARKRPVAFGERGAALTHDAIEIGYVQRPRLALTGRIVLDGEVIEDLHAEGAQDRHWRSTTELELKWLWLHLRLSSEREVNCYVIEDCRRPGRERGRGGWCIDASGEVRAIPSFELRSTASIDTPRGQVPTQFRFRAESLGLDLEFVHAVKTPFVPMLAFGELVDGGIYEAPIRVLSTKGESPQGWLEVFDSRNVRARTGSTLAPRASL